MSFIKFAPKNIKICPGCPPKEIPTVTTPKFTMSLPAQKNSKVVSIKDNKPSGGRTRRGDNTTLF